MVIQTQIPRLTSFMTQGKCTGEAIASASLYVELRPHTDPHQLIFIVGFDIDADYEGGGALAFEADVRNEIMTTGMRPTEPFLLGVVETCRELANRKLTDECLAKGVPAPVMRKFDRKTTTELIHDELNKMFPPRP